MDGIDVWAEDTIKEFFKPYEPQSFTAEQCHDIVRVLSGASKIHPVGIQGSLSYTVVASDFKSDKDLKRLIISFRLPGSKLEPKLVDLAKEIHGDIVPIAVSRAVVDHVYPPLEVYTMNFLPGVPILLTQNAEVELTAEEEVRHACYIRCLARYFARCWLNPQPFDAEVQLGIRQRISRSLENLKRSSSSVLPEAFIADLEESLPALFDPNWSQVLTHGDLSITNILLSEETGDITGLVDWSLAKIRPFGLELDVLRLSNGYMNMSGWHDYECRSRMEEVFWAEFWDMVGIEDGDRRSDVRRLAEMAGMIGAVLRYGMKRNADGSASEEVREVMKYLEGWYCRS